MNLFGHVGLTLAAAYPIDHAVRAWVASSKATRLQRVHNVVGANSDQPVEENSGPPYYFDYRLIIIGSIIPDIIDKPLGFFIAPELVNYSIRSIGHSGVFAMAFLLLSLFVLSLTRSPRTLVMALASAGHLILDEMWTGRGSLQTLFWPLRGWSFAHGGTTLEEWLYFHTNNFSNSSPIEYFGLGVIVLFCFYLLVSRGVGRFLVRGIVH